MVINFPLVKKPPFQYFSMEQFVFFDIQYYSRIKKVYLQVRLLGPGHLEEDYPITTFFRKQNILKFFFHKGSISFMNLMAVS